MTSCFVMSVIFIALIILVSFSSHVLVSLHDFHLKPHFFTYMLCALPEPVTIVTSSVHSKH